MRVTAVRGLDFRCYERVAVELPPGLVGVIGPNGAGKTSLIEMIHFALVAYSPRTSNERRLVRLGQPLLRAEADVVVGGSELSTRVGYRPGEPKHVLVDGAPIESAERLLSRFPVLVFTPDRMRLVQGAPALRRSYFDRVLVRLWPAAGAAAAEYGRALVQRNHLLRRIRSRAASVNALDPWDEQAARWGAELIAARLRLVDVMRPALVVRSAELGGEPGEQPLRYIAGVDGGHDSLLTALRDRRGRDIERATTGVGPHLDDWAIEDAGRDLRSFGSQGEQRRALLGLILAEADVLTEQRGERPLLLLDDVTGEFDAVRRELLLRALTRFDQAVVTTTDSADLGDASASLIAVDAGTVSVV